MTRDYKKINEAEVVIWVIFLLGLYTLNDILDGLAIGLVIAPIINFACTGGTWFFFKEKGDTTASKPVSLLVQVVGDAIPFIPAPVLTFAIKVYLHNHPKAASAVVAKIPVTK